MTIIWSQWKISALLETLIIIKFYHCHIIPFSLAVMMSFAVKLWNTLWSSWSSNIVLMFISDHIMWSSAPFKTLLMPLTRNDSCTNSSDCVPAAVQSTISYCNSCSSVLNVPFGTFFPLSQMQLIHIVHIGFLNGLLTLTPVSVKQGVQSPGIIACLAGQFVKWLWKHFQWMSLAVQLWDHVFHCKRCKHAWFWSLFINSIASSFVIFDFLIFWSTAIVILCAFAWEKSAMCVLLGVYCYCDSCCPVTSNIKKIIIYAIRNNRFFYHTH